MKFEWTESTIEQICTLVTDGAHNSPKSVENGEYMASVKDFTEYGFNFSECRQISKEDYLKLKKQGCVPEKGDILVGKDGARFFEDIIIYSQDEEPALLSSIAILRVDRNKVTPEFLYYTLKTPEVKKDVQDNYGSGSAIPRIVLKDFKRMPVFYPSIDKQKSITGICESIDNRIKLNTEINRNLAEMLQAVYQQIFSSEPRNALADICSYSKDRVSVNELTVDDYYSTENMLPQKAGATIAANLPTTQQVIKCHIGDVLISNIRPYFKKILYCYRDGGCSNDVLCFTPKSQNLTAFLYSTLYADHFFDFMVLGAKGTKMPRGDKQQIMTYPIRLPSEKELDSFNLIAFPLMQKIHNNTSENVRLSAMRDTLLPRLMSGEIDVSSIEI